ncbi:AAA family ATPase [Verrucosispora sp. TAA-831]|uniref:AAA family ATPase n=1 Tax=Verrucosispora sp. TAA-831 TaxID=3422227 RepID=UPI003D6E5A7E
MELPSGTAVASGTGLVERDHDLVPLRRLLDDGSAGRGGAVIIAGPPGSGKTALLRSAAADATARGFTVLEAAGSPAESTLPLGVLSQLFYSDPAGHHGAGLVAEADLGDRWLHDLFRAAGDLARDRPLALCVDDLQHIDRSSLRWLLYLTRRIAAIPVVVVGADCDVLSPAEPVLRTELLSRHHTRRIDLRPLSQAGVARILGGRRSGLLSPATEYHRLTGGSPALLRGLLADSAAGFTRAVDDCLYRLEAPVLQMARCLAVLGDHASTALAGRLGGLPAADVDRTAALLARTGLLDDGGRFRHPLAGPAVLDGMAAEHRADLHRRAARLLHRNGAAVPVVAAHLAAATPLQEQWAVPVLRAAADHSVADGDTGQAVRYLGLAHRIAADEGRRASLATALTEVQWRAGPAGALVHLIDLAPDGNDRIPLADAILLPRYLAWYGRGAEAQRLLNRLGVRRPDLGRDADAALSLSRLIVACLAPAHLADLPAGVEFPGGALIAALRGEPTDPASEQILPATVQDSTAAATAGAVAALLYSEHVERAVRWSATPTGDLSPTWRALLGALRAEIALRAGNLPAAEHLATAALDTMSRHDWGLAVGAPLSTLLTAQTLMGKHREADEHVRTPLPAPMFDTLFGLHFLDARGRHHLAAGRPHAALSDFLACGDLMRGWNVDRPGVAAWRLGAADSCLRLRRIPQARAYLDEQLTLLTGTETRTRGYALVLLAAATDLRGRPAKLRDAVRLLREQGDRLGAAYALADLGRAYHALGDSAKARTTVHRAGRLAEECGAAGLSDELLPPPAPESPQVMPVAATLSDAERRVASLAAYGHTNREIAGKLYITISTVEQHLTRIYRKLAVNSRASLSEALLGSAESLWDESA